MERTALLYLCGLLICSVEASDSSCRLKDLTMQPQCCTPKTYIEVKFFLRLRSNGGCDSMEYLDQGIRFEVGIDENQGWIPIRYYTATTAMGPSSLAELVNNTHVEALSPRYNSTFPLQVYNSTEPIMITEYLCGEQFVTPVTRFRWFQRHGGASLADKHTWSLDNLTITLWNGSCHSVIMEDNFEDVNRTKTNFAENTGGILVEPPCGETASGKAIYFQGNISGGVSKRRLKMHRTDFTSPTTNCYTPLREGSGCSLDGTSCVSDASVCSLGTFDCSCKVGYRRNGFICVDVSVGLEHTTFTVSEDVGDVEVCAVVISGTVERTLALSVITTDSSAAAPADYDETTTELIFSAGSNRSCARVNITDDETFENVEDFTVRIATTDTDVPISHNNATVVITDNDWVRIGFTNEPFWAEEDELSVEVCVAVTSGTLERKVIVSLTAESGSAHDVEDYIPTHALLTFQPDVTRKCLNVVIVNDTLVEGDENFIVKLMNEEAGVVLDPARATVQLEDDDLVRIGFEDSHLTVRENEGSVDVCTVLSGSLQKTIDISIHTENKTATEGSDYSAVSAELRFSSNTTKLCTAITVEEDDLIEEGERFSVHLECSDPVVLLSPAMAVVNIIDCSGGTCDLVRVKQQVAAGRLSAANAVDILDDLLNSQLSDRQTATAAFSMAFLEAATTLLDTIRSESEEELLNEEEATAIASQLLITLDRFALNSFNPDDGGELQTDNLKLRVLTANQNDNLMIVGIEEDGNEIVLPPEIIRRTGSREVRVASYYFQNMSGVLPDTLPGSNESRLVSPVISSALGCSGSVCGRINTTNPVRVVIRHEDYQTTLQEPSCVFWEFVNDVNGKWSKQGCEVNKEESNRTTTVCLCTHLTHFAILLSPRVEVSERDAAALSIIGYVGVSVSLTCLLLTIAAFLFLRSLWGMRNYIHINLCISLFVAQLIFVAGVDKTSNEKACQAIAVLLHYFFLVTFMWMLMEGVVLYVALVRVFVKKQKYYIAAFTIVSYGLPALYMGVTVPLGFLLQNGPHYGSDAGCWLRYDTHFIWAFIAPVILVILANTGFFIMAICIMYRHDKRRLQKSKLQSAKHWLRSCISLVIIMGISWIIGVLAFHQALLAVSYIFTIFIAFQGLFIFILFVPVSKQVRESYRKWWRSKVAGSDFLSQYFSVEKQRRFTRTTSLGSSIKASKHEQSVVDFCTTSQADGVLQDDVCIGDTKTPPLPTEYEVKSMEMVFTELGSTEKITAANAPLENNTEMNKDAEESTFSS